MNEFLEEGRTTEAIAKDMSIGRNIMIIVKYFRMYFRNAIKNYGLNTAEGMVLLMLFEQGEKTGLEILKAIHEDDTGRTQEQIIEELHYDKSVMTRTMQSLESKGYVQRKVNEKDSRSYIFKSTEKASAFMPELIYLLKDWNDILLKDIEQVDTVKKTMEKMSFNARHSISKL